jgi:predicted transcriptional regulator
VKAAIELNNYFEEHYQRVLAVVNDNNIKGNEREFYDALPDSFSTDDAKPIANEIDISERSMYNYLQSLMKKNLLKQISRGSYEKIRL